MVFGLAMADRGGLFAGMGVALRFAAVSTVYGLGAARHWQTRRNLAVVRHLHDHSCRLCFKLCP